jgi:serine/threonine protein kinase
VRLSAVLNAASFLQRAWAMTSEPATPLAPDDMVGSYRIVKEIGRGGMGIVYEAVHAVLPRRAAVKIMHADLRRQPGMASRMVQEAGILEDIRHAGLVRVYECNLLPDHRPWIAMELVEGETLASRLHYATKLPPVEVAMLLAEVADVLAAVHARNIIHRDLKPDNLLLTPADANYPLRVIDWGVARLGAMGRLTLDGMTPGTPIYMAPEQATGRGIGAPCDVYALGVIAYEALCGKPPFDGRTLAEVVCMHLASEPAPLAERTNAPPALCALVHRMLDKEPSLRPGAIEVRQLARAVALDLTAALEREHVHVHRNVPSRPAVSVPPPAMLTDEVVVIDPDSLENGITEMLPVVPRPRWTPQLRHQSAPITPKAPRDEVAGEIELPARRRD